MKSESSNTKENTQTIQTEIINLENENISNINQRKCIDINEVLKNVTYNVLQLIGII